MLSVLTTVRILTDHGFAVRVNGAGVVRALVGSTTGRGDGMVTDYVWEDVPHGTVSELRDWLGY